MLVDNAGIDIDSYRTEVLSILTAFSRNGGLHFSLDNRAAYDDIIVIITKSYIEFLPNKPWPLVKQLDLLELVHELSNHRRREPILGTWLRGHTTEEDVRVGIISERNRAGNDRSDAL